MPGDSKALSASLPAAFRRAFDRIGEKGSGAGGILTGNTLYLILDQVRRLADHPERERILSEAAVVSFIHRDLMLPFLRARLELTLTPREQSRWLQRGAAMGRRDAGAGATYFQLSAKAHRILGPQRMSAWSGAALAALVFYPGMSQAVRTFLAVSLGPDFPAEPLQWRRCLQCAARIAGVSPAAATAFVRRGFCIFTHLSTPDLSQWIAWGLNRLTTYGELTDFFAGTAPLAVEVMERIAPRVRLSDRLPVLALICEACLGRPVRIRPSSVLAGRSGFSGAAATDGEVVYLPDRAADFNSFKLMALHQTMLLDFTDWPAAIRRRCRDPRRAHLEADRRLLRRMPALHALMASAATGRALPAAYPETDNGLRMSRPMPWWGDLLFELLQPTGEVPATARTRAGSVSVPAVAVADDLGAAIPLADLTARHAPMTAARERVGSPDLATPGPEEMPTTVQCFHQKEWDRDIAAYRPDWCVVRNLPLPESFNPGITAVLAKHRGLIGLVRRHFARLKPDHYKRRRGQTVGDGLDIDALITAVADRRCRLPMTQRVYIHREKKERDVAVLFLMDASGSTGEPVNGRRFITIQKEAVVLMSAALEALGDPYALYAFNSEGRFRVNVMAIKPFAAPFDQAAKSRLGNLVPDGLTRLGAAVRHGAWRLGRVKARTRLLMILTDGRPYDYAYGNLEYAVADTRQAFREARRNGIRPFIITSDSKGADYLARITPLTRRIILRQVQMLPRLLPRIYRRLTT